LQKFTPVTANHRFKTIQDRRKHEAKRYNKSYTGELVHFDTKRLPLLKGQSPTQPREYLFVAIDDFSRELYADILPDKTQNSAVQFLVNNLLAQCPCQVDYAYSDNGKAERVIRTLMEMWHDRTEFKDCADRQLHLGRFINFYNTVKSHKALNSSTPPYEILYQHFKPTCKQPGYFLRLVL
jgi:hypothetical protein